METESFKTVHISFEKRIQTCSKLACVCVLLNLNQLVKCCLFLFFFVLFCFVVVVVHLVHLKTVVFCLMGYYPSISIE